MKKLLIISILVITSMLACTRKVSPETIGLSEVGEFKGNLIGTDGFVKIYEYRDSDGILHTIVTGKNNYTVTISP